MALGSSPGIDAAPAFDMTVNGYDLDPVVGDLITSIEYDSGDGLADMLKLKVSNPEFEVSDKKVFRTGNLVKLWGGYGSTRTFIGGARIEKVRPDFPSGGGMPTIEIVGFSGDKLMMRNAPSPREFSAPFSKNPKKSKKPDGRVWSEGLMYSDAIRDKARFYGFRVDVDDTPAHIIGPMGVFQKADMTDFDFVSAIANELGWLFWVDADEDTETWTLHFKDPDTAGEIQDRKFDFPYNSGNQTSCLSFEAEEIIGSAPTSLQVQFKNHVTNELQTITVEVDPTVLDSDEYAGLPGEDVKLRPPSKPKQADEIIIAFGDSAVKTVSDRHFGSIAEADAWAQAWYREHVRDYIRGKFTTRGPGSETLTARQVHSVSNLGAQYSGDYYLTNVNQFWTASSGHMVTANGRKISNV